jgi:hypothetical protein
MATFDFTLSVDDIGAALAPADGYLVNLSQTSPSSDRSDPQFSAAMQRWKTGYISLRGERDRQAIYCNRSSVWTPLWSGDTRILITNQSLDYHGRLVVECVPKGSTWSLTLSDVPIFRAPAERGGGPYTDNRRQGIWGTSTPR